MIWACFITDMMFSVKNCLIFIRELAVKVFGCFAKFCTCINLYSLVNSGLSPFFDLEFQTISKLPHYHGS